MTKNNEANPQWQDELTDWLTKTLSSVDDFVDLRRRRLTRRLGIEGVPMIQSYVGYGNHNRIWLHGRVLTNPPTGTPAVEDHWWSNLLATYRRFASDEVPGVSIRVDLGSASHTVTTDAEGYFYVDESHDFSNPQRGLWSQGTAQIIDHELVTPAESLASFRIMTPPATAKCGIISDVDDTILHTGSTKLLTMAQLTVFGNAMTRLPLPGVASLYQALQRGPMSAPQNNPVFYVSSSPWNLFDLLEDFIELSDLPPGPILLRDLGFDDNKLLAEGHDHKLDKIRRLLKAYPEMPFLLFGDSGQDDAELYATAAEEFPDQIRAIFVRDIDPGLLSDYDNKVSSHQQRALAVGVPMHFIENSLQAAEASQTLEFLTDDQVQAIEQAVVKDNQRWMPA